MNILIKKLHSDAVIPVINNIDDAGADLFSIEDITVHPLSRQLVKTGISIEMPSGVYAKISPRSGLALKHGIDILAGVIDSGYRGEICILVYNTDKEKSFQISSGDKIAQLIFHKYLYPTFILTEYLSVTDRSNKGFGSSGIK